MPVGGYQYTLNYTPVNPHNEAGEVADNPVYVHVADPVSGGGLGARADSSDGFLTGDWEIMSATTLADQDKYFEGLVDSTKTDSIRYMFHVEVAHRHETPAAAVSTSSAKGDGSTKRQVQRAGDKIGRNDACPCGSGKKYKRCHGAPGADPLPA